MPRRVQIIVGAALLWGATGLGIIENFGPQPVNGAVVVEAQDKKSNGSAPEIIVYASDLTEDDLSEFDFLKEPVSPESKLIGTPNTGGELDPPPENDPHVTFKVQVQQGVPYRCWIHMKVGAPKGLSKANKFWVQFTGAVDKANKEILKPRTNSYLTAQGPEQQGWAWVSCDFEEAKSASESLIQFQTSGEITVRMQAGMEGVAFDQLVLSPAKFLDKAPTETIVKK
ncbi:MAG: hypothetical protein ACREOO_20875 [bacterium]